MHLKTLVIDYLTPDGVLTTYRAIPKSGANAVVIDRLADVSGAPFGERDIDIGAVRLYNSERVEILKNQSQIRAFTRMENGTNFEFGIEHFGLDVGFSRKGEGGLYYFIAPHGFRATDIYVSDPYDNRTTDEYARKQFDYQLHWDTQFLSQVVEMHLRSSRGTFSFRLGGRFAMYTEHASFLECSENKGIVNRATGDILLKSRAHKSVKHDIATILDSLEFKPTVFGVGVDVPKFIRTVIGFFRADKI